jgi:hypothetical protein
MQVVGLRGPRWTEMRCKRRLAYRYWFILREISKTMIVSEIVLELKSRLIWAILWGNLWFRAGISMWPESLQKPWWHRVFLGDRLIHDAETTLCPWWVATDRDVVGLLSHSQCKLSREVKRCQCTQTFRGNSGPIAIMTIRLCICVSSISLLCLWLFKFSEPNGGDSRSVDQSWDSDTALIMAHWCMFKSYIWSSFPWFSHHSYEPWEDLSKQTASRRMSVFWWNTRWPKSNENVARCLHIHEIAEL